jgi:hypothetical protein
VSLVEHGFDEMAADEAAGAGDEDVGFVHLSGFHGFDNAGK